MNMEPDEGAFVPYARNRADFRTIAARRRERIREIQDQLRYIDGVPVHPDPPNGHGSSSAYNTAGCRCAVCLEGARGEYARSVERKKRAKVKPPITGTMVDLDSVFSFGGPATTTASED